MAIVTCLLANACGGGHAKAPLAPGGGDHDAQVEPTDAGQVSAPSDAGKADSLAPVVEFTEPMPVSDPNADTVITETSLVVGCRVARSADNNSMPINTATIKITLESAADTTKLIAPPVTTQPDGVYQATFDLSAFPNGRLRFHCEAKDLATTPHVGKATLETLLDLGPTIELFDPKDKGIYPRGMPVVVQFKATAAAISDSDGEAKVAHVSLNVSGDDTPVMESSTAPGLYQASVDFNDTVRFPVPPTSAQIVISVSDGRTPIAATRKVVLNLAIDGEGPSISIDSPPNLSIVHGVVTLAVTVNDPAGLTPNSLKAEVNKAALVIDQWEGTAPSFRQKFDTRAKVFPTTLTELTINVSATDAVGNVSTKSHRLRLDNLPPVLSLDPPLLREYRVSGGSTFCSAPYDPVGDAAASDGQTVLTSWHYRALVEDRTNHSPGAATDYLAGVNQNSVTLYVQSDNSTPLLIDTDGNGTCDEINGLMLMAGSKPWTKLLLSPVAIKGGAWYPKSAANFDATNPFSDTTNPLTNAPGPCMLGMDGDMPPPKLCPLTEMFRVVPARVIGGMVPAVYALAPTNDIAGECEGGTWGLGFAKPGWLCLAARAEDTIGNIGISAPLRVCLDDGSHPACLVADMPTCTNGLDDNGKQISCTISAAQTYPPNMIWQQQ